MRAGWTAQRGAQALTRAGDLVEIVEVDLSSADPSKRYLVRSWYVDSERDEEILTWVPACLIESATHSVRASTRELVAKAV